jgi:hypothetical protein
MGSGRSGLESDVGIYSSSLKIGNAPSALTEDGNWSESTLASLASAER